MKRLLDENDMNSTVQRAVGVAICVALIGVGIRYLRGEEPFRATESVVASLRNEPNDKPTSSPTATPVSRSPFSGNDSDGVDVKVVDDRGQAPIASAFVRRVANPAVVTEVERLPLVGLTDAEGILHVGAPGVYLIGAPGYATRCERIDASREVALSGGCVLRLRVAYLDGSPAAAKSIFVSTDHPAAGGHWIEQIKGVQIGEAGRSWAAVTDARGFATIQGVAAGRLRFDVLDESVAVLDRGQLLIELAPGADAEHEIKVSRLYVAAVSLAGVTDSVRYAWEFESRSDVLCYPVDSRGKPHLQLAHRRAAARIDAAVRDAHRRRTSGPRSAIAVFRLFAALSGASVVPRSIEGSRLKVAEYPSVAVPDVPVVEWSGLDAMKWTEVDVGKSLPDTVGYLDVRYLNDRGEAAGCTAPTLLKRTGGGRPVAMNLQAADGESVRFGPLSPGKYRLEAEPRGVARSPFLFEAVECDVAPGENRVDVRLSRALALVDVKVVGALGLELREFSVASDAGGALFLDKPYPFLVAEENWSFRVVTFDWNGKEREAAFDRPLKLGQKNEVVVHLPW
jgi:hypothetical protein